MRRYGFGAFQPSGYFFFASSSETAGRMITSSPCFQFTGVATLCFAVSWHRVEQPQHLVEVAAGAHRIGQHRLDLLVGADRRTPMRTVALSAAVRPSHVSPASAGSMSYTLATLSSGSPIIG